MKYKFNGNYENYNKYCSKKKKILLPDFLRRHMSSQKILILATTFGKNCRRKNSTY